MNRTVLKSKLHRVTTTHSELDYEGSCAIDEDLLEAGNIREYERIEIYNVTNGERFSTYAIRAERGSGIISVNGAAARKAQRGDLLIIATYGEIADCDCRQFSPSLIYVDSSNRISRRSTQIPVQAA